MGHKNYSKSLLTAIIASTFSSYGVSAELSGTVTTKDGDPIPGAMVRITNSDFISEVVYTNKNGRYTLSTELEGELNLRTRKRYHADDTQTITLKDDSKQKLDITLRKMTDATEISNDAPSLAHFSQIDFDENGMFSREIFGLQCINCHSLGNSLSRWPRSAEQWKPTIERMFEGRGSGGSPENVQKRAELLSAAFNGKPLPEDQLAAIPYNEKLDNAKIYQWRIKDGEIPHDIDIIGDVIYAADMTAQQIVKIDIKSGEVTKVDMPAGGSPPGGMFAKAGREAPFRSKVSRAPHSLVQADVNGLIYITDSYGGALAEMDPETNEFTYYQVGDNSWYPHTIREGLNGMVWATIIASNQVARLNTKTKEMTVVQLPVNQGRGEGPYGIDVSPIDGSVWYAKIGAGRIGRIDPETLEVTEFDSPVPSPRRHRFDAKGNLWIAGFRTGQIAKVEVDNWKAEVIDLPIFAPGQTTFPYALSVHPQTQDVWVADTQMDALYRYIPGKKEFITYPLPLKGTYTRDVVFTDEGWACASNNPIPAAALEGGHPEVLCIDTGES